MDGLQFLASIIDSLAWPATVAAIVVLLRKPLGQILLTLTRLKYKDLEIDFRQQLKELEEAAEAIEVKPALPSPDVGGPKESKELLDEAKRLASEFPEPAVAVAWSAVEYDLMSLAERTSKGDTMRKRPPSHMISYLHKNGIIDGSTVNVLKRMMNLRNLALHERWNAFGEFP